MSDGYGWCGELRKELNKVCLKNEKGDEISRQGKEMGLKSEGKGKTEYLELDGHDWDRGEGGTENRSS